MTALTLGCSTPPPTDVTPLVLSGEFGRARVELSQHITNDKKDRRYLLDRMKFAIITLADGYPQLSQLTFEQIYDILRTQGINEDKTVQSVVLNEDLKFWKGEPFEQALAMTYYSAQQASLGNWDNARAAASNSLFRLRDFSGQTDKPDGQKQKHIDSEDIARRAMQYENAQQNGTPTKTEYKSADDYLDHGYAVRESNFTLGYLMKAVAASQLARIDEFRDNLAVATQIDPQLKPLTDKLYARDYNTLLLVSYGLGPAKTGTGPDQALAKFVPRYSGNDSPITVQTPTTNLQTFPVVCDVNAMASDHMWNNLEDIRVAKAVVGQALMTGGAIASSIGYYNRSNETAAAGLAAMALGAVLRAGAHVDTRYCDLMPQRFYLVPVYIDQPNTNITLMVSRIPSSSLTVTGLSPPKNNQLQFRYIRLPSLKRSIAAPPAWATSGQIDYFNDSLAFTNVPPSEMHPYITGGRSVATPNPRTLAIIQSTGHLNNITSADLQELYRAEQITWQPEPETRQPTGHVLEGGRSLLMPQPGTTGFTRLFGQIHQPYQPKSQKLRDFINQHAKLQ